MKKVKWCFSTQLVNLYWSATLEIYRNSVVENTLQDMSFLAILILKQILTKMTQK